MSASRSSYFSYVGQDQTWYDLFSRGARDWLRHNEKVREAVRDHLADVLAGADVITGGGQRKVRVPIRVLEHYRFRLHPGEGEGGVGQGPARPGDVLRPGQQQGQGKGAGGGEGEGGLTFVVELEVNDIVDWLWEELELPNLEPRPNVVEEDDYTREGWNRKGVRARLDRRRTLKEAIKRRTADPSGPAITNEDLRYRQLVRRTRPATQAVVFFALDASSSMQERDRKLAKSFFFWALQGLRRQYRRIETVFVAHTVEAWEFTEDEFFQVTAQGGTVASCAFDKVQEILDARFDPARYNAYLFYASDGENFPQDRAAATQSLLKLGAQLQFAGYVETTPRASSTRSTETSMLFARLAARNVPSGVYLLAQEEDVWDAIRQFFSTAEAMQ